MVEMAGLAFIGGVAIGINRILLGKLSVHKGAYSAAYWNHVSGAIFIFAVILLIGKISDLSLIKNAPPIPLLGGIIGAFFTAIAGVVFTTLGAMRSTILIISG